ncbi:polyphosphate polymerase domain-containing protein [Pseudodesulfovibrio thermohalotolerans]|uniref:polyphosphate polymerase domain-containing protein n=1 Tax=Pseudodesulfovibrio thermohalotolerans TaxID=2880651 RepID=UPI002442E9E8|nr:polyphosphate polymerase domain-containing protein [Pseudodesulfovibrio thermohalotolerans]WFS61819.1 polyphosphate polymerase domain-containing protein [Pseudodesulfovibrio thermohalotolerans]
MAGNTDGTLSYRYERKYVVPFHMLPNLGAILRRSRFGFREIYAERNVLNVYFDTPMFRFYHENVQGVADRKKVRIRWYADGPLSGKCRLEIKRKSGLVGAKNVYPLTLENGDVMGFRFLEELPLPDDVRFELSELRPTLFNKYKRRYFLSADGRFRMTIDHSLHYSHPSVLSRGACMGSPDRMAVLELKYAHEADCDAAYVTSDIPLQLSRKSKYVTGISTVYNC